MYWALYTSEAEISDQKLVETLTTDTTAISILVSCDTLTPQMRQPNPHVVEWHFLGNSRDFHRTNVPVSSARQQPSNRLLVVTARLPRKLHSTNSILSGSLSWGTFRGGNSVQYPTPHQFLPSHYERPSMRSNPAMVLRIHEVRLSPCGATQARARTNVSVSRP